MIKIEKIDNFNLNNMILDQSQNYNLITISNSKTIKIDVFEGKIGNVAIPDYYLFPLI